MKGRTLAIAAAAILCGSAAAETDVLPHKGFEWRAPQPKMELMKAGEFSPDQIVNESGYSNGTMEAPGGETWYYTSKMEYDYIVHEYFTEPLLKTYSFTIYDAKRREVGKIFDVMRYGEDEIRVPDISLVPLVTRHFFNDDDKYEIMISLAINTVTPGIMHFRNEVYSIGGPKEQTTYKEKEVTVDVPVYTVPGRLGDVLDASEGSERENYYLTFFSEYVPQSIKYPDGYPAGATDDEINRLYWENVCTGHIDYTIYTSKGTSDEIRKVYDHTFMTQRLPGDQESTPPMISFMHGGTPYFLFQEYKETLFNPYREPHIDPDFSVRDANTLGVWLLRADDDKVEKINAIEIPFVKESKTGVLMTTLGIGDFRYREDIDFDTFDTGDLPAYFLTRSSLYTTQQTLSTYMVYGPDGAKIRDIFEDAESFTELSDFPGEESQINFINKIAGVWYFNFINLPSCEKVLTQSWLVDMGDGSDVEKITSNIDRARWGDTYAYAAEMRLPIVDENDNNFVRVMWFDQKGKVLAVHEVNVGEKINYATCFIDSYSLDPELIYSGPEHEYMVLVKRAVQEGSTRTQEELVIGQPCCEEYPSGRTLMHLSPNDGNGTLSSIIVIPGEQPKLSVSYSKSGRRVSHIYNLPLDASSGIEDLPEDKRNVDNIEGVYGEKVTVVSIDGRTVLLDAEADALRSLSRGLYIVNGRKVLIK